MEDREIADLVAHVKTLTAEVATIRKENEMLHSWLTQQRDVNTALHDMISAVNHKVTILRGRLQ
jgi:hypothetical protein